MFQELTLPGVPGSVPVARRFVQSALTAVHEDDLVWTASLLVTELVTNAALHARTEITIAVTAGGAGSVRLEVRDGSGRLPRSREYGVDATTGRRLRLIADLAARRGIEPVGGGKTVWVELDRPDTGSLSDASDNAAEPAAFWLAAADDGGHEAPGAATSSAPAAGPVGPARRAALPGR